MTNQPQEIEGENSLEKLLQERLESYVKANIHYLFGSRTGEFKPNVVEDFCGVLNKQLQTIISTAQNKAVITELEELNRIVSLLVASMMIAEDKDYIEHV